MKVILLAAGKGTRIKRHIDDRSKCMLEVDGNPLIVNTVKMLIREGINDISVIVGYKKEQIIEVLKPYKEVTIYENPFYSITNSIGSLWFALQKMNDDDLIIANGDTYWDENILQKISKFDKDFVMLGDKTRAELGDYFFKTKDGCVELYGKELLPGQRDCEYAGIAKILKNKVSLFKQRLLKLLDNKEFSLWWEDVLYSFVNEYPIHCLDVDGLFWAEVDFIEDYERILNYVKLKNK